jgi:hypothetical protein
MKIGLRQSVYESSIAARDRDANGHDIHTAAERENPTPERIDVNGSADIQTWIAPRE